jgi:hypothetical protein
MTGHNDRGRGRHERVFTLRKIDRQARRGEGHLPCRLMFGSEHAQVCRQREQPKNHRSDQGHANLTDHAGNENADLSAWSHV